MTAISSIPNLGPASEAAFAAAGITTAEQLRELGANEAYRRLLEAGTRPHFIGYYVLVMGLQGRPWNDCHGEEKQALRREFDKLKATATPSPKTELDAFMDQIGILPAKSKVSSR